LGRSRAPSPPAGSKAKTGAFHRGKTCR
jgi:hypothetical protein